LRSGYLPDYFPGNGFYGPGGFLTMTISRAAPAANLMRRSFRKFLPFFSMNKISPFFEQFVTQLSLSEILLENVI